MRRNGVLTGGRPLSTAAALQPAGGVHTVEPLNAETLVDWIGRFSYPAVYLLLCACGVGAPLSEDLIVLAGGVLAAKGGALLWPMAAVAWAGSNSTVRPAPAWPRRRPARSSGWMSATAYR